MEFVNEVLVQWKMCTYVSLGLEIQAKIQEQMAKENQQLG